MTTVEGAVSLQIGPPTRPLGEQVAGHNGQTVEDSPATLANRPIGTSTTATPQGVGEEAAPSAVVKIVRATMRILLHDGGEKPGIRNPELRKALSETQRLATTASNLTMRSLWRADSASLDAFLVANGRMPTTKEWKAPSINGYQGIRAACPMLGTGIVSVIARMVETKWYQVRYDVLVRQKASCPQYRFGQAFPLRAQEVRITQAPKGTELSFVLRASKDADGNAYEHASRYAVTLQAKDAEQGRVLHEIATGAWKYGNVILEQDRLRPYRWYARISYTRFVDKRTEGITAAVNRGIKTFVAAVTQSGEAWLYDGYDIEAYLKQIQRRRQKFQRDSKASERWGHGRTRTLRPIASLEGKATRWRQTKSQVVARRLARWLAERKVCRVYIEDFSGIRDGEPEKLIGGEHVWKRVQEWPYYQLESRLRSCLEEAGIECVSVDPEYISQRCPRCGTIDVKNRDLVRWKLRCVSCKHARHLDVAAALNVLARGEATREGASKDSEQLPNGHQAPDGTARKPTRKGPKGGPSGGAGRKS